MSSPSLCHLFWYLSGWYLKWSQLCCQPLAWHPKWSSLHIQYSETFFSCLSCGLPKAFGSHFLMHLRCLAQVYNGFTTSLFCFVDVYLCWAMFGFKSRKPNEHAASVLVQPRFLVLLAQTQFDWLRGDVAHLRPDTITDIFTRSIIPAQVLPLFGRILVFLYHWCQRLSLIGSLELVS